MTESTTAGAEVLCVGEVLWDSLPGGLFLGGAPLNVACHLVAHGVPTGIVSRVGDDRLGREAVRRAAAHGVATDLVQTDARLPTGFVAVSLDAAGNGDYDIVSPSAWDALGTEDAALARAAAARAVVYGSLAQRSDGARVAVERLADAAPLRVFDVNLRMPHWTRETLERSLARAHVVKLNDEELRLVATLFSLPDEASAAAEGLATRFGCAMVAVTRGARGAALWHLGAWTEHAGFPVTVADTVGSGDAFLAALLSAHFAGAPDAELMGRANLAGAYVASRPGAVPAYDPATFARIAAAAPRAMAASR